jgi:hypothetical protein
MASTTARTIVGIACISALALSSGCSLVKSATVDAVEPVASRVTVTQTVTSTTSAPSSAGDATATSATTTRSSTATKPAAPLTSSDRLTVDGLGPLTIGMTSQALLSGGYMEPATLGCEGTIAAVKSITDRGIWLIADKDLYLIEIHTPDTLTKSGAHVGVTMKQLVAIYGATVQRQNVRLGENSQVAGYVITGPRNILIFLAESGTTDASDVISTIILKPNDGAAVPIESC